MKPLILIVTFENDFHALIVEKVLNDSSIVDTALICVDKLFYNSLLNLEFNDGDEKYLIDYRGKKVFFCDINLVWWRRFNVVQNLENQHLSLAEKKLIENEWDSIFFGALMIDNNLKGISNPISTQIANNKIFQLSIAKEIGLNIPRTLISNSPDDVRAFINENNKTIVKTILGTKESVLYTCFVSIDRLTNESIKICPAIYQEYITGTIHLRVNVFGDRIYTAAIETTELDWRGNLNVPIYKFDLDKENEKLILNFLKALNLKMGVIDLKLQQDGKVIFLEINPQGQFLFLEGLTKQNLLKEFTDFLIKEATFK